MTWIACGNCNRGGRGNDKDLCSCGWRITEVNDHGCYCGTPIVGEPRRPPKLTTSQRRYQRFLNWADATGGSFREFLLFLKREKEEQVTP